MLLILICHAYNNIFKYNNGRKVDSKYNKLMWPWILNFFLLMLVVLYEGTIWNRLRLVYILLLIWLLTKIFWLYLLIEKRKKETNWIKLLQLNCSSTLIVTLFFIILREIKKYCIVWKFFLNKIWLIAFPTISQQYNISFPRTMLFF